jgi:uncharacterized protein YoxC
MKNKLMIVVAMALIILAISITGAPAKAQPKIDHQAVSCMID